MKKWKIAGLSLVLGGTFLLTGCLGIQFRTRPRVEEVEEIVEVPEVEEFIEIKVEEPIEIKEELITTHIVVKGETLWDIAGYEHIFGDPLKWTLIYEANKDILDDPHSLKPGQELIIPRE